MIGRLPKNELEFDKKKNRNLCTKRGEEQINAFRQN